MRNIVGHRDQLLKRHGQVDISRCVGSIFAKAGNIELNINDLNSASKLGGLYVMENGKILDDYSTESEFKAKYKIVPTGLTLKDTKYPIFASFLKFQNEQIWRGAYFGTGEQLFVMYKQHYFDPVCFDNGYINVFCNSGVYMDLVGFGLKEVLKNAEQKKVEERYESSPDLCVNMREAIAKCLAEAEAQDSSTKGKRVAKKAKEKAEMLQRSLDKIEAKQKRKNQDAKESKVTSETTDNTITYEVAPGVTYEVTPENSNETVEQVTENTERKENVEISIIEENNISEEEKTESEEVSEVRSEVQNKAIEDTQDNEEFKEQQLCGNMNAEFVKSLYSRILYKEKWMTNGNRRLDFYIKNLINLLEDERSSSGDKQRGNGYTYSKSRARCVLNLGILDIYGNDIYIVDNTPNKGDFKVKDLALVESKVDLLAMGFTQDEVKQLPLPFDLSKYHKDCVFEANVEDFDFLDVVRLNHIIEERRDRFPNKFKDESCKIMCDKLKEAIVMAVRISKTDCRYVIPKYDFYRRKIQFMIPLHLDNNIQDPPELAIIVGKNKNIWNVHTIITLDDALADARILFRTTSWLRDTL